MNENSTKTYIATVAKYKLKTIEVDVPKINLKLSRYVNKKYAKKYIGTATKY